MSKRMKIAFGCYLLNTLNMAAGGVVYVLTTQFMPFHAIAVGKTWDQIDPAFQVLLLTFIRVIGGGVITVALSMGILLFIPFRQGIRWARWAIPAIGIFYVLMAYLYPLLSVALNTSLTPPWGGAVSSMILVVAGFILSLESKKKDIA